MLAVAEAYAPKKVLNFLKIYPEPIGNPAPDVQTVTVEVIKGTVGEFREVLKRENVRIGSEKIGNKTLEEHGNETT